MKEKTLRPDIFLYHDHISFLTDWFAYLKKTRTNFSMRELAKKTQIASGYIPMVLSGKRELTEKSFQKIASELHLNPEEKKHLSLLRIIGTTHNTETRIETLSQIVNAKKFQNKNVNEFVVHEYLTKWQYVVIREMVNLDNLKMDVKWIQDRLKYKISSAEINNALEFLKKHQLLAQDEQGKWYQPQSDLQCKDGVFKLSLGQFHRQIFELAARSIDDTVSTKRYIGGHTVAIADQDFTKAKEIIDVALKKLQELGEKATVKDDVYHFEIAAFPLTENKLK